MHPSDFALHEELHWPPEAAELARRIVSLELEARWRICDAARREWLRHEVRRLTIELEAMKAGICAAEGLSEPTTGQNGAKDAVRPAAATDR